MGDGPCGHRSGSRLKYFFHQHRAVWETPVLLVRTGRAGRHRRRGSALRPGLGGCHRNAGAYHQCECHCRSPIGHQRLPDVFSAPVFRSCPTRFFCSKVRYADPAVILPSKQRVRRKVPADYPLVPQDPEELGTDEPPDVSKSARDRPCLGDRDPGKRSALRRRGRNTCLSSSVAAASRFRRALRSMPSSRRWSCWRGWDDHDFCAILRRMLRAKVEKLEAAD